MTETVSTEPSRPSRMDKFLVFLDLETTTLDHDRAEILEIAVAVYSFNRDEVVWKDNIVIATDPGVNSRMTKQVIELHEYSCLIADLDKVRGLVSAELPEWGGSSWIRRLYDSIDRHSRSPRRQVHVGYSTETKDVISDVEMFLVERIRELCDVPQYRLMLSGSGVSEYDRVILRRLMPKFEDLFHYRTRDLSMVRSFLIDNKKLSYGEGPFGDPPHRAIDDVMMFVDQHRYLLRNLRIDIQEDDIQEEGGQKSISAAESNDVAEVKIPVIDESPELR